MDHVQKIEQKLAIQIRYLQKIHELEIQKQDAIEKDDLDAAEKLQENTNALITETQLLARAISALQTQSELPESAPGTEKIAQLQKAVKQLAGQAADLTGDNRQKLLDQIQDVFKRLDHVRTGKAALAGYQENMGRAISDKGPNRGEK